MAVKLGKVLETTATNIDNTRIFKLLSSALVNISIKHYNANKTLEMLLNQRFRGFFRFCLVCKIEQDNALIRG